MNSPSSNLQITLCLILSWAAPLHAPYKINFDGALFKDISAASLGVVICNSCGEIIGAMLEKIPIPFTFEEVGMWKGHKFCFGNWHY